MILLVFCLFLHFFNVVWKCYFEIFFSEHFSARFLSELENAEKAFKYRRKRAFSQKQTLDKKIIILTPKYGVSRSHKGKFKGKCDFNKNQLFMNVQTNCVMYKIPPSNYVFEGGIFCVSIRIIGVVAGYFALDLQHQCRYRNSHLHPLFCSYKPIRSFP